MRKIKGLLFAYDSYLRDMGRLAWFLGVIAYPIIGICVALWTALIIHPSLGLIPLAPPLVVAIRADIQRSRTLMKPMTLPSEQWKKALNDYVEFLNKSKKQSKSA